jgi:hypothetical protein
MNNELLIKGILGEATEKIQEEVSGMLGRTLTLEKPTIRVVSKEGFFSEAKRKLVLTRVAVKGDLDGEMFIFTPLRDAILFGGTLIMLPPSELKSRIKKEEFGEEENDAFGEIANILSGVINTLFEDNYPGKLRFVKTDLQPLSTAKIDGAASEPFPPQNFLLGSYAMKMEEHALGTLDVLFPTLLFPLEDASESPSPQSASEPVRASPTPPPKTAAQVSETVPKAETGHPLVLILADQGCETEALSATLRDSSFDPTCLGFHDNPKEFLRDKEVRGIFLVMREVSEQGFAAAIRVRSATRGDVPLIAVGPRWTRNSVLKAVKFGIRDILVTPASAEEIHEKIVSYLLPGKT